jgi:hypothetical protein
MEEELGSGVWLGERLRVDVSFVDWRGEVRTVRYRRDWYPKRANSATAKAMGACFREIRVQIIY